MDLNVTSIIVSGRNGKINCQNLSKQSSLSQKKKKKKKNSVLSWKKNKSRCEIYVSTKTKELKNIEISIFVFDIHLPIEFF